MIEALIGTPLEIDCLLEQRLSLQIAAAMRGCTLSACSAYVFHDDQILQLVYDICCDNAVQARGFILIAMTSLPLKISPETPMRRRT